MKTVCVNVYQFSELSEKAQQKAIDQYRGNSDSYFYYADIIESVKAACKLFNLKTGRQWSDLRMDNIDDNILELSGIRLYKYIINNYWNGLFKRKFLGSIGKNRVIKHRMSKTNFYDMNKGARVKSSNFIYSNIQFTNSCTLTGICYDDDILKPIYEFLKKPDMNTTFEQLIGEMESAISETFDDTEEWLNSDEHIIEEIETNGYEFTEDGERY